MFSLEDSRSNLKLVEKPLSPSPEIADSNDPPSWRNTPARHDPPARRPSRSLEIPNISEEVRRTSRAPHEGVEEEPAVPANQMQFEFKGQAEETSSPAPSLQEPREAPAIVRESPAQSVKNTIEEIGNRLDSARSAAHNAAPRSVAPHSVAPHSVAPHSAAPHSAPREEPLKASLHHPLVSEPALPKEPKPASPWRGVALFAAPLFGFLALLGAFAYYLQIDHDSARKFSDLLFPGAAQVAPAGLYIKNVKFKKVVLDTGHTLQVISGKIQNDSPQTFKEILLNAMAFDELGKPMNPITLPASPTLAKSRIRALSPDLIRNLQSGNASPAITLKPGQNLEFAIALGEAVGTPDFSQAKYFSTRIYTVRR